MPLVTDWAKQKWKQGQARRGLLKHVWEVKTFIWTSTLNQAKVDLKTLLDYDLLNRISEMCFSKRDAKLLQTQENMSISIKLVHKHVYKQAFSAIWKPCLSGPILGLTSTWCFRNLIILRILIRIFMSFFIISGSSAWWLCERMVHVIALDIQVSSTIKWQT